MAVTKLKTYSKKEFNNGQPPSVDKEFLEGSETATELKGLQKPIADLISNTWDIIDEFRDADSDLNDSVDKIIDGRTVVKNSENTTNIMPDANGAVNPLGRYTLFEGESYIPEVGKESISFGLRSRSTKEGSISIGAYATTQGIKDVVIGWNASSQSTDEGKIVIGYDSVVRRDTEQTIEEQAAIAIGYGNLSYSSIAIGTQNTAQGNSIVIGRKAYANYKGSVVISGGYAIKYGDLDFEVVSTNARAELAPAAVLINGFRANSTGAIVIGGDIDKNAARSIAIGVDSSVESTTGTPTINGIALGVKAKISSHVSNGIAIGTLGLTSGTNGIAIGTGSKALGEHSITIGPLSGTLESNSIAFGYAAQADNAYGIAIGKSAQAGTSGSIAIGSNGITPTLADEGSVAIGSGARANIQTGVAIGFEAIAQQQDGIAIGYQARAHLTSVAIGSEASTSASNSCAIGKGATASASNTIVLGNSAIQYLRCQQTTIQSLSDERVKENIELANTEICLNDVLRLPVSRFKYKNFTGVHLDKHRTGFMATDVQKVFPKSVQENDEEFPLLDDEGNEQFEIIKKEDGTEIKKLKKFKIEKVKSIAMEMAIPTLWGAIQEQQKLINNLRQEIDLLKQK